MAVRVLIVDDDASELASLELVVRSAGYDVDCAASGEEALEIAAERRPDVVVTDLAMPGCDGIELLRCLRPRFPDTPVIVVTGHAQIATAVRSIRAGAEDYIVKPLDMENILLKLHRAVECRRLRASDDSRPELRERESTSFEGLIGSSFAMREVYELAVRVAPSRATVLITGESGTGKGELARAIHAKSPRAERPFVTLHCAVLAESLLESELFGHERGAFTGADRRRLGRFEQADGGTLFLDEIAEIPTAVQAKLLRVLQDRTFERVGGDEPIKVDVRVIAATNRDLNEEVRARRLRPDLYYRLAVVSVRMPPLRTRAGDILLLANHFLRRFASENGKCIERFSDAAVAKLLGHGWPGNVRELENAIERAVLLADGPEIEQADLPFCARGIRDIQIPGSTLAELERYAILSTLDAANGSTGKAAEMLGVSIRMIQYRLHEYGRAGYAPRGGERKPAP